MDWLGPLVLSWQDRSIRSLSQRWSSSLSSVQAHYVATVVVSTLSEALLFALFVGLYYAMRALPSAIYDVPGDEYRQVALAHANATMATEALAGLLLEKRWQDGAIGNKALMDFLAVFYKFGLWAVIGSFHVWVLLFRSTSYAVLRNGFWLTTLLSGAFVLLWPVAPPRLTPGAGVVDTIVAVSGWSNPTVGPYDSCPSLHFSWSLIVCFGTLHFLGSADGGGGGGRGGGGGAGGGWGGGAGGGARSGSAGKSALGCAAVLYPALTLYAVVVTGNHWLADVMLGAFFVALGFILSRLPPFRHCCEYHDYHMIAFYQQADSVSPAYQVDSTAFPEF